MTPRRAAIVAGIATYLAIFTVGVFFAGQLTVEGHWSGPPLLAGVLAAAAVRGWLLCREVSQ